MNPVRVVPLRGAPEDAPCAVVGTVMWGGLCRVDCSLNVTELLTAALSWHA